MYIRNSEHKQYTEMKKKNKARFTRSSLVWLLPFFVQIWLVRFTLRCKSDSLFMCECRKTGGGRGGDGDIWLRKVWFVHFKKIKTHVFLSKKIPSSLDLDSGGHHHPPSDDLTWIRQYPKLKHKIRLNQLDTTLLSLFFWQLKESKFSFSYFIFFLQQTFLPVAAASYSK